MSGGSSPLTRGKQRPSANYLTAGGLIPAHAGKTHHPDRVGNERRAHPRSRGENEAGSGFSSMAGGSSPLTRGKPSGAGLGCAGPGLIPAHAGKTLPDLRFYCADRSDLGKP